MSEQQPLYGITWPAPWAHLIVHGPLKRLENRRAGVATIARRILGQRVALTCSATTLKQARLALLGEAAPHIPNNWPIDANRMARDASHMIGHAVIAAVESPEDAAGLAFHRRRQWALILDDVVALDTPRPSTGNQDIWRAWYCSCGRIVASGSSCRTCTPPMRRRR